MALQPSGVISAANLNTEWGQSAGTPVSWGGLGMRDFTNKGAGEVSIADCYGIDANTLIWRITSNNATFLGFDDDAGVGVIERISTLTSGGSARSFGANAAAKLTFWRDNGSFCSIRLDDNNDGKEGGGNWVTGDIVKAHIIRESDSTVVLNETSASGFSLNRQWDFSDGSTFGTTGTYLCTIEFASGVLDVNF